MISDRSQQCLLLFHHSRDVDERWDVSLGKGEEKAWLWLTGSIEAGHFLRTCWHLFLCFLPTSSGQAWTTTICLLIQSSFNPDWGWCWGWCDWRQVSSICWVEWGHTITMMFPKLNSPWIEEFWPVCIIGNQGCWLPYIVSHGSKLYYVIPTLIALPGRGTGRPMEFLWAVCIIRTRNFLACDDCLRWMWFEVLISASGVVKQVVMRSWIMLYAVCYVELPGRPMELRAVCIIFTRRNFPCDCLLCMWIKVVSAKPCSQSRVKECSTQQFPTLNCLVGRWSFEQFASWSVPGIFHLIVYVEWGSKFLFQPSLEAVSSH
jgi:hypothetical protein